MWKRLLLVTAVSAAMSSMAMAAPLTVGFSQVGSESGWRAAETNVAKSEAEKRGITLKIADGQQKQENQIKAVRSFVAQGVDAIFIAPVVATDPRLKPPTQIPTFTIDGLPDIYTAMIDGEANASVELTPNMAGPAFDALEKFKKDGTMPEKLTITKSILYLPDTAKEELEKKKNMGY